MSVKADRIVGVDGVPSHDADARINHADSHDRAVPDHVRGHVVRRRVDATPSGQTFVDDWWWWKWRESKTRRDVRVVPVQTRWWS
jgi:hypothetical protein